MSAYGEEEGYEDVEEDKKSTAGLLPKEPEPPPGPPPTKVSCSCLLWSVIWLAVLIVFAWPLSVAMAALYGFVSPMITLLGFEDATESILQAVNLGRECARNVRTGRPFI